MNCEASEDEDERIEGTTPLLFHSVTSRIIITIDDAVIPNVLANADMLTQYSLSLTGTLSSWRTK